MCPAHQRLEDQALGVGRGRGAPQAQERLDDVLARLRREGVTVEGDIGDADPIQAMEDALGSSPQTRRSSPPTRLDAPTGSSGASSSGRASSLRCRSRTCGRPGEPT
jgi:hypothetical protein